MLVEVRADPWALFRIGEERFFLLEAGGKLHAVPEACPHRGGPLSKSVMSPCRRFLTCPMHQLPTKVSLLLRKERPAVRVGEVVKVVVEDHKFHLAHNAACPKREH